MSSIGANSYVNTNISVSQIIQALSSSSRKVDIPVQYGLSFSRINGYSIGKKDEEISVAKAIQINSLLERLSKEDNIVIKKLKKEFESGKIAVADLLRRVKEVRTKGTSNPYSSLIGFETKGNIINSYR